MTPTQYLSCPLLLQAEFTIHSIMSAACRMVRAIAEQLAAMIPFNYCHVRHVVAARTHSAELAVISMLVSAGYTSGGDLQGNRREGNASETFGEQQTSGQGDGIQVGF